MSKADFFFHSRGFESTKIYNYNNYHQYNMQSSMNLIMIISEEILINYCIYYFLGGQAGAMDEDSFIQAFEDVKKLSIFNGRDVTQELSKIKVLKPNIS